MESLCTIFESPCIYVCVRANVRASVRACVRALAQHFSSLSQPYQRLAHALRSNSPGNTAPLLYGIPDKDERRCKQSRGRGSAVTTT
jgi:hypothetical protein